MERVGDMASYTDLLGGSPNVFSPLGEARLGETQTRFAAPLCALTSCPSRLFALYSRLACKLPPFFRLRAWASAELEELLLALEPIRLSWIWPGLKERGAGGGKRLARRSEEPGSAHHFRTI